MTIDITILDCCKLRKTPYPWPNDISLCIVPLKTMEKQFVTRFKSDFTSSLFFRGWYIYICIERYPNCNCLEIWHPSPSNRLKARRCTRCFQTFCIVSCAGRCHGISRIHWGPYGGLVDDFHLHEGHQLIFPAVYCCTGIYGGDIVGLMINLELGPSSCITYTWLIGDEASINEIW